MLRLGLLGSVGWDNVVVEGVLDVRNAVLAVVQTLYR